MESEKKMMQNIPGIWHLWQLLLKEYAPEEVDLYQSHSYGTDSRSGRDWCRRYLCIWWGRKQTQRIREVKAADRIYGILPEDQGEKLRELWEEFEEAQTPEAKFAHVMDNVQPAMLNDYTEGKDWSAKGVRLSQILERNAHTAEGSQKLWDYAYTNLLSQIVKPVKN